MELYLQTLDKHCGQQRCPIQRGKAPPPGHYRWKHTFMSLTYSEKKLLLVHTHAHACVFLKMLIFLCVCVWVSVWERESPETRLVWIHQGQFSGWVGSCVIWPYTRLEEAATCADTCSFEFDYCLFSSVDEIDFGSETGSHNKSFKIRISLTPELT